MLGAAAGCSVPSTAGVPLVAGACRRGSGQHRLHISAAAQAGEERFMLHHCAEGVARCLSTCRVGWLHIFVRWFRVCTVSATLLMVGACRRGSCRSRTFSSTASRDHAPSGMPVPASCAGIRMCAVTARNVCLFFRLRGWGLQERQRRVASSTAARAGKAEKNYIFVLCLGHSCVLSHVCWYQVGCAAYVWCVACSVVMSRSWRGLAGEAKLLLQLAAAGGLLRVRPCRRGRRLAVHACGMSMFFLIVCVSPNTT